MARINGQLSQSVETNAQPLARHEFKVKNLSKMINILRNNLYKHKTRTLIQEYTCNARDAVREKYKEEVLKEMPELNPKNANNSRERELKLRDEVTKRIKPEDIVISFPTELDPFFKVRDYGVGLSPERVSDVFTYYCESTKDESELETGGFGIGAKSAWAYTDHFQVISYHNGKKYLYSSHTEIAKGVLDLDAIMDTTEANGVEIIVAVNPSDIKQFTNYIYRICFFWETRPVFHGISLADQPDWFDAKPDLEGETWSYYYKDTLDSLNRVKLFSDAHINYVINLDGVPFAETASNPLKALNLEHGLLVYKAPIGVLDIIANREELDKSKTNMEHLHSENLAQECKNELLENLAAQDLAAESFLLKQAFHAKVLKQFDYKWLSANYPSLFKPFKETNYSYRLSDRTTGAKSALTHQYEFQHTVDTKDECIASIYSTRFGEGVASFFNSNSYCIKDKKSLLQPFLVQDEFLSKKNRRIKCICHAAGASREIILLEIDDQATLEVLRQDPMFAFTSDIALEEKEKKEINRAKGVYTLQKLSHFSNSSRSKFQHPREYFENVPNPFLLMEESNYHGYSTGNFARHLMDLNCSVFTAAPTTIKNLVGKPNIYLYSDFIKNLEKNLPLKKAEEAFLYATYFESLKTILEMNFSGFLTKDENNNLLIDLIEDPQFRKELNTAIEFQELIKAPNKALDLKFYNTHYPKTCAKIAATDSFVTALSVLKEKLQTYPLISACNNWQLTKEVIFYINAKHKQNKKK